MRHCVWFRALFVCAVALVFVSPAHAAGAIVAWDRSPEPDVAGYVVYWGLASGAYTSSKDGGNHTELVISNLRPNSRYYVAVRAYNAFGLMSGYSVEVTFVSGSSPGPNPRAVPSALRLNADASGDVFSYSPETGAFAFRLGLGADFLPYGGLWSPDWRTAPGDFNGDGLSDMFVYNVTTGDWFECLNDGAAGFTYRSGTWSPGWDVTVMNLNGDARSDIFLYNKGDGVWFRCANAWPGSFSCTSGQWSPQWIIQRLDLTGDGVDDLLLYSPSSGQWFQAVNDGVRFVYFTGFTITDAIVRTGDFNGDRRADAIFYNPYTGDWRLALTNGYGFTEQSGLWSPEWTMEAGEFDGDGLADVLLYNTRTGVWFVALWKGIGFTYVRGVWSPLWQATVVDFDGDNVTDVFLYNPSTGQWFRGLTRAPGVLDFTSGFWEPGLSILAIQ